MQPQDTNTPLRQLYFVVQTMLIDPAIADRARAMFKQSVALMLEAYEHPQVVASLRIVESLVSQDRRFDALKAIRALFPIEARILAKDGTETRVAAA
jgi:flagellar protein FlbT